MTCPNCGATITAQAMAAVRDGRVACSYCGTSVPLPSTGPMPSAPDAGTPTWSVSSSPTVLSVDVKTATPAPSKARGPVVFAFLAFWIGALVIALVTSGVLGPHGHNTAGQSSADEKAAVRAHPVRTFAGKGTGSGLVNQPSKLAVDPAGDVWVADYHDGRIQEFSPAGQYLRALHVPGHTAGEAPVITGLAVDGRGHVYVTRDGDVVSLDARTGHVLWTDSGWDNDDGEFGPIAVTSTGVLYAIAKGGDGLVRFGPGGHVARRWPDLIDKVDRDSGWGAENLAINSAGDLYLLTDDSQIYRYRLDGTFVDRFGSGESGPGEIDDAERALVADPHGRVYVPLDGDGVIERFDPSGRYEGNTSAKCGAFIAQALGLDSSGNLFTMDTDGLIVECQVPDAGGR